MALRVKNLPTNSGDVRDARSIPGSGRFPGGGHSNPLQCSCLENPVDRGAWWAAVHSVTKSWTRLKRRSRHTHTGHWSGAGGSERPLRVGPLTAAQASLHRILSRVPSHRKGVIPVRAAWEQGAKSLGCQPTLRAGSGDVREFSSFLSSPSSAPGTGTGEDGDPGGDGAPFPKHHSFMVEAGGSPHRVTGAGMEGGAQPSSGLRRLFLGEWLPAGLCTGEAID